MIFGVFLHLVQDLQAHRAKVVSNMIVNNGAYSKNDKFTESAYESRINTVNIKNSSVGSTLAGLVTLINSSKGLPMIRLKDYLIDELIVITVNGIVYICADNQAYEDNPYFYSYRFSTAQSFSESYMAGMRNDTADRTNRTTYLISSEVPLV